MQRLNDLDAKNGFVSSLLKSMFKSRRKRILNNRFNKWRKVPKIDMKDVFDKYKQMIKFTEMAVNKSLEPSKKELLKNMNLRKNPKQYRKAVD